MLGLSACCTHSTLVCEPALAPRILACRRAQKAEVPIDYVLGVGGFDLEKVEDDVSSNCAAAAAHCIAAVARPTAAAAHPQLLLLTA